MVYSDPTFSPGGSKPNSYLFSTIFITNTTGTMYLWLVLINAVCHTQFCILSCSTKNELPIFITLLNVDFTMTDKPNKYTQVACAPKLWNLNFINCVLQGWPTSWMGGYVALQLYSTNVSFTSWISAISTHALCSTMEEGNGHFVN